MQTANNVQFLCSEHKQAIAGKPEYAALIWSRLMKEAKDKIASHEWNKSVVIYGNAFEVADILINDVPSNSDHIERYTRTATEFAYALRQCSYISDVSILVSIVEDRLRALLYPADTTLITKALRDCAFATLPESSEWMKTLKAMEESFMRKVHA